MASGFNVSLDKIDWDAEMRRVEWEIENIVEDDLISKVEYATDTLRQVTPVDTGRARASWKNNLASRGRIKIFGMGRKDPEVEITGNVPYMEKLNTGWSKQAPAYFIEEVLIRIGILSYEM